MDPRLQEMLDHYEITQLLAEYCRGCDRVDAPHMASVYARDSWDDHGVSRGDGRDFTRRITKRTADETESMSHLLGQSVIRVDGDEAGAETYFLAVTRFTRADGSKWCSQLGGRYVDRLIREDGRWRISRRTAVRDWSVTLKVEEDTMALAELTPGRRSSDDPSFEALGRAHQGQTLPD